MSPTAILQVMNASGAVQSQWTDPVPGKTVTDLAVAPGGVVYASGVSGLVSGTLYLDRYEAPGSPAWSRTVSTGLARAYGAAVAVLPDGGAVAALASSSENSLSLSRFDAAGNLSWTATAAGQAGRFSTYLGLAVDGAGVSYLATAVSVSGRTLCQILKFDATGAPVTLASWAPDAGNSGLHTLALQADGSMVVGGYAGKRSYMAQVDAAGTVVGEWFGPTPVSLAYSFSVVEKVALRSDGGLFATMSHIDDALTPDWHTILLGVSQSALGQDGLPGFYPTPTPSPTPTRTPTPSPADTWTPPVSQSPTATMTATPTLTAQTPTMTATPSSTPTVLGTEEPTPGTPVVLPGDCSPSVEKVQVVPCPVLSVHGGRLKVRLGACLPDRLQITIYTQGGTVVQSWSRGGEGLAAGWNDVALPAGQLSPGFYYFRVTAIQGDRTSSSTNSCLSLR
jgi:hypothetical protein